jgi:ADP-heptose:LPS heptosyltransferase
MDTVILGIEGGLGKSIMATAVLKAIKKQYRKSNIVVSTAYPDVFINNPNVNKIITHSNNNGIYRDLIHKKNAKVFVADPYTTSDYITEQKHLIQIWCEMFGVPYENEMPELFLSKAEKQYYEPFYRLDKPILAIQPHGGAINQPLKYSWTRDIPSPIVQQVVERYKNDYAIVHIKREDQLTYANTVGALDNFRSIAVLLSLAKKRLLIDSSAMHIATALHLPSVVTWVGTSPKVFGYEMHQNILCNPFDKPLDLNHSYYQRLPLFEDISKIPYNDLNNVFDIQTIFNALS